MMLFRTSDIIMVMVMLCAAFLTYQVKYEAQRRYGEEHRLQRRIAAEQDSAAVLRARWALATEPGRMEQLANRYHDELGLEIIQPRQIVKLQDIPPKLPDAIQIAIKDSDALIAKSGGQAGKGRAPAGLDNITTASVATQMGGDDDSADAEAVKANPAEKDPVKAANEIAAALRAKNAAQDARAAKTAGRAKAANAVRAKARRPQSMRQARRRIIAAPAGGGLY